MACIDRSLIAEMAQIRCGRVFEKFFFGEQAVYPGEPIADIPFEEAWEEVLRFQMSRFDWDVKNPKTPAAQMLFQAVASELPSESWRNTLELYVSVGLAFDVRHHSDCVFLVNGRKRVGIDLTIEHYPYKLARKRRIAESSPIPIVVIARDRLVEDQGLSRYAKEIAASLLHGSSAHRHLLWQIQNHDHETVRRSMARRSRRR